MPKGIYKLKPRVGDFTPVELGNLVDDILSGAITYARAAAKYGRSEDSIRSRVHHACVNYRGTSYPVGTPRALESRDHQQPRGLELDLLKLAFKHEKRIGRAQLVAFFRRSSHELDTIKVKLFPQLNHKRPTLGI